MPNLTPGFLSRDAMEKMSTNPLVSGGIRGGKSAAMAAAATSITSTPVSPADKVWIDEASAIPDEVWNFKPKITTQSDQRNDPEKVGELLAQMTFKLGEYDARLEKAEKRIQDLEGIIDAINDPSAGSF